MHDAGHDIPKGPLPDQIRYALLGYPSRILNSGFLDSRVRTPTLFLPIFLFY